MAFADVTVSIDTHTPPAPVRPPADLAVTGLAVDVLVLIAVVLLVVGAALTHAVRKKGNVRA